MVKRGLAWWSLLYAPEIKVPAPFIHKLKLLLFLLLPHLPYFFTFWKIALWHNVVPNLNKTQNWKWRQTLTCYHMPWSFIGNRIQQNLLRLTAVSDGSNTPTFWRLPIFFCRSVNYYNLQWDAVHSATIPWLCRIKHYLWALLWHVKFVICLFMLKLLSYNILAWATVMTGNMVKYYASVQQGSTLFIQNLGQEHNCNVVFL